MEIAAFAVVGLSWMVLIANMISAQLLAEIACCLQYGETHDIIE